MWLRPSRSQVPTTLLLFSAQLASGRTGVKAQLIPNKASPMHDARLGDSPHIPEALSRLQNSFLESGFGALKLRGPRRSPKKGARAYLKFVANFPWKRCAKCPCQRLRSHRTAGRPREALQKTTSHWAALLKFLGPSMYFCLVGENGIVLG